MACVDEDASVLWRKRSGSSKDEDDDDDDGSESNIWDDSALIEAYDKAVSSFKNGLHEDLHAKQNTDEKSGKVKNKKKKRKGGGKQNNKNKNKNAYNGNRGPAGSKAKIWNIGDKCLAMYYEDGLLYSATIITVNHKSKSCTVRYDYYKNEAQVDFKDLFTNTDLESIGESDPSEDPDLLRGCSVPNNVNRPIEFVAGWRIGDPCLVPERNGTYRKGIITSFPSASTCEITFLHNKGSTTVDISSLHSLQHTSGDKARYHLPHPHMMPFNNAGNLFPPFASPNMADFQASMMPPFLFGQNPFTCPVSEAGHDRRRPPPPPPPPFLSVDDLGCDDDALSSMLMSWYMVGYHTGFYQGMQQRRRVEGKAKGTDVDQSPSSSMGQDRGSPENR